MNIRFSNLIVFFLAILSIISFIAFSTPVSAQSKPNIILFLVDDMGYHDISPYANDKNKITPYTPNLQKLADEGLKFTNYYTNPLCGPSRAALMSGQYAQRFGLRINCNTVSSKGLPKDIPTLGTLLKSAGYKTHQIGKWHLGDIDESMQPKNRGFDTFYGQLQHKSMYKWINPSIDTNDRTITNLRGHVTDVIGNEAVRVIYQHAESNEPFFINYWEFAPHGPHLPTAEWLSFYPQADRNKPEVKYAAMITGLDAQLGKIMEALKATGQEENTMIIFTSDNGIHGPLATITGNGGLRGNKTEIYEGGIKSPLIVKWPGVVPAAKTTETLSAMIDIFPTFAEVVGASQYKTDGLSLLNVIKTANSSESFNSRYLIWDHASLSVLRGAVRNGEWKYTFARGVEELFNIKFDPEEKNNLAGANQDIFNRLKTYYWQNRLKLANTYSAEQTRNAQEVFARNTQPRTVSEIQNLNISGAETTISAWVNLQNVNNLQTRRNIVNSGGIFRFEITPEYNLIFTWRDTAGNEANVISSVKLTPNKWQHVAVTIDAVPDYLRSGRIRLYIDGQKVGQTTRKGYLPDINQITIGNTPVGNRSLFGQISNLNFYNAALLGAEIKQLQLAGFNSSSQNITAAPTIKDEDNAIIDDSNVFTSDGSSYAPTEFTPNKILLRYESGLPVSDAVVRSENMPFTVYTDFLGNAELPPELPETLNLQVSTGAETFNVDVNTQQISTDISNPTIVILTSSSQEIVNSFDREFVLPLTALLLLVLAIFAWSIKRRYEALLNK